MVENTVGYASAPAYAIDYVPTPVVSYVPVPVVEYVPVVPCLAIPDVVVVPTSPTSGVAVFTSAVGLVQPAFCQVFDYEPLAHCGTWYYYSEAQRVFYCYVAV